MEALVSDLRRLRLYIDDALDEPPIDKIVAAFHRAYSPRARLAMPATHRRREEQQLLEILRMEQSLKKSLSWQIVDGNFSSGSSSRSSCRPFSSSSSSCSSDSSSSSPSKDPSEAATPKLLPMTVSPSLDSIDAIRDPAKVFLDQCSSLERQQHAETMNSSVFQEAPQSQPRSSSSLHESQELVKEHLVTFVDELIGVVQLQEGLLNNMVENNLKDSHTLKSSMDGHRDLHRDRKEVAARSFSPAASQDDGVEELKKRVMELETIQSHWLDVEERKRLVLRRGFLALLQAILLCICLVSLLSRIANAGITPT